MADAPPDLPRRKSLTFEQAEGAAPLPTPLRLGELSKALRACLWHDLHQSLLSCRKIGYECVSVVNPWRQILLDMHARRHHQLSDEFKDAFSQHEEMLKLLFARGDYLQTLGWLQWVIRHPMCPKPFIASVTKTLIDERAAYRILDADTIYPVGSASEADAIGRAFADLDTTEFHGARSHLKKAGEELTSGKFADSVRESIHAVEGVARSLEPSGELSKALAKLETTIRIHGAMRAGFNALYGYTSDKEGIRHALLSGPASDVDEADALFMLGACAAFVSYLINKGRMAGLL